MTEIEKMYENANAYKTLCNCEFKNLYDYRIEYGSDVCDYTESKIKEPCKVCEKAKQKIKYYPDFTAEKQIELIKWLCQKTYRNYLLVRYDFTNYYWLVECNMTDSNRADSFSEALASVCNNLWQDLADQEKEEIRNILK